ncbi:MAG: hypothetical protein JWR69_3067 [Pedosphaera sp.]|nr:hypothetical protein [Pedosphaera sp.]
MTSFVVRIFFGEVPWRFVGISSDITRWARLEPQGAHNWEGIVPISSRFSNLGPEHPGFVELGAGEYTLQLICAIDWDLPVRTPFSPDQRAAVIADKFDWELASNVIHFQIA